MVYSNVRVRGLSGLRADTARGRSLTQPYGPAVRCKPDLNKWRMVLRICIRPLHGAFVLLAIMDTPSRVHTHSMLASYSVLTTGQ